MMPPIFGSMMFISAANFISSWPMIAQKGYTGLAVLSSTSESLETTSRVSKSIFYANTTGSLTGFRAKCLLHAAATRALNVPENKLRKISKISSKRGVLISPAPSTERCTVEENRQSPEFCR
jgi:hypothetical protein